MKPTLSLIVTTAALIAAVPAGAQTAGAFMANPAFQGPRPAQCTSTLDLQRCAAHDLRAADAQMSARYAALRARLRPAAQQTLLVEQRAWLKSRDRDCMAKYDRNGGSMASLVVARCWVATTQARARQLAARLPQAGGGTLPATAFVGRWRGGEGTYMKISRRGTGFLVDNQWGLDADMHGVFPATITPAGLRFRRGGAMQTVRPSPGDAIDRSALRGQKDCLMVSRDEGYCRY